MVVRELLKSTVTNGSAEVPDPAPLQIQLPAGTLGSKR